MSSNWTKTVDKVYKDSKIGPIKLLNGISPKIIHYLLQFSAREQISNGKALDDIGKKILLNPYCCSVDLSQYLIRFQNINQRLFVKILRCVGFQQMDNIPFLKFDAIKLEQIKLFFNRHSFIYAMQMIKRANLMDLSSIKESVESQQKSFESMDLLMGKYYKQHGIKNYFDFASKKGKLLQFIEKHSLIDNDISIEFQLGDTNWTNWNEWNLRIFNIYLGFDYHKFPLPDCIDINDKVKAIYFVLHCCYKYQSIPTDQELQNAMYSIKHKFSATYSTQSEDKTENAILQIADLFLPKQSAYRTQVQRHMPTSIGLPLTSKQSKQKSITHGNEYSKTNRELTEDTTNEQKFNANAICICGRFMIQLKDASKIYGEGNTICDVCWNTANENDTYYHCIDTNNETHPFGYDVCVQCMNICQECSASKCGQFERFLNIMQNYCTSRIFESSSQTIEEALECYFHVLLKHDGDDQFKQYVNKLSQCDIQQCEKFRRNYRYRNQEQIDTKLDVEDSVNIQCMDKLHCYIYHSNDGCQSRSDSRMSINNQLQKPLKVRSNKSQFKILRSYKYNQFPKETKQTDQNVFHLGYAFSYNVKNKYYHTGDTIESVTEIGKKMIIAAHGDKLNVEESKTNYDCDRGVYPKRVRPKYHNLKQELINNKFVALTMLQFYSEYKKSQKHFNSRYCKSTLRNFNFRKDLSIEYVLSVMIYCNFTLLQYEFSKTYRDNKGNDHDEFYYFGKYINIMVNNYGTSVKQGDVFYHGISTKMLFPIGQKRMLCSQCPLSTTSSKEVAISFTNFNQGMILKLAADPKNKWPKYLEACWLSDFINEKERLFVQMRRGLMIENITDAMSGYDYRCIVMALSIIKSMLLNEIESDRNYLDVSAVNLIEKIVLHCLERETFESLEKYAELVCKTQFASYSMIDLTYSSLSKTLREILIYSSKELNDTCNCIDIHTLNMLCPNIETVIVRKPDMKCPLFFEHTLKYFENQNDISKIKAVTYFLDFLDKYSWKHLDDVINEHSISAEKYGIYLCGVCGDSFSKLCYLKSDFKDGHDIDFVCNVIDNLENVNIGSNNQITQYIDKLIQTELKHLDEKELNCEQILFHDVCSKKETLNDRYIDWNSHQSVQNANSYIFNLISNEEHTCFDFNILLFLFPNLSKIGVHYNGIINPGTHLTMFDTITLYLKTSENVFKFPSIEKK
eukprot:119034_1